MISYDFLLPLSIIELTLLDHRSRSIDHLGYMAGAIFVSRATNYLAAGRVRVNCCMIEAVKIIDAGGRFVDISVIVLPS